ncbi:MAG: type IV pilus assembly protein PilM [Candidatus Niyogibacteria bacterium]|nr:type IV pilus assembly protein PilM [Candidatus Niyogibacteria bacterium]
MFLARFFPPPNYLDMPMVAVDISDRSIKYAELIRTRRGLRLGRFGSKKIEANIVEAGEIKKPADLSSILASIFKPQGADYVIASLPEERAYVATLQLPHLDPAALAGAIELELPEHIPLPRAEALFDYHRIPVEDRIARDGIMADAPTHTDVVVYAFPRVLAETYVRAFLDAGLRPAIFEMETQALARSLLPATGSFAPVMIVDFGKTRTTFVIVVGSAVRFASTVSVAGESLEGALVKALDMTATEAEKTKKEKGMIKGKKNEAVFNALLPIVSAVTDEIERHLLFWNTHAEHAHQAHPQISKIILSGGDANLIGFKEYVAQKLRLPVVLGNVWMNVSAFDDYVPEIPFADSLGFAASVGMALRAVKGE